MSTNFAINILVSLLKEYGIKHLVLSSGTRNIPFVGAVETDTDFTCYSVVDERNAAFFALGLAQQTGEAVGLACTSGTAVSNYLSGITEAYYSRIPLVAITFDRSMYTLNQMETQKIEQTTLFNTVCKKTVSLPVIKDEDDLWYYKRLINEALIAMRQHGNGPVHINIPLPGETNSYYVKTKLNEYKKSVHRIDYIAKDDLTQWEKYRTKLVNSKRILLIMGQQSDVDERLSQSIKSFCSVWHCPVLLDNLANFKCDEMICAEAVMKGLNAEKLQEILPEIVISFGNNFQERIKDLLKAHKGKFEHWSIRPEGIVEDVFKSQTALFECMPEHFFEYYANVVDNVGNGEYLEQWRKLSAKIKLPDMPWGNFYAIRELAKLLPKESILHLSIQNATRLFQFFDLDESIKVYSNVNAFGIDGCLPTFLGQAMVTDKLAFMVVGDLSFFYGMNALTIRHQKNNIRICLINNGGGAEFHISPNSNSIPTIDLHIGAAHSINAEGWAKSLDYTYLTANDEQSLMNVLPQFVSDVSDRPILLEVFTNMKQDGEFLLQVYRELEMCL